MSSSTAPALLSAARRVSESLARCASAELLLSTLLASLQTHAGLHHAAVLLLDAQTGRLRSVAQCGDAIFGEGFEEALGQGLRGMAARDTKPVRLFGHGQHAEQLALPLVSANRVLGLLCVCSPGDGRFGAEFEDLLVLVAGHLAAALDRAQNATGTSLQDAAPPPPEPGAPLQLRRYPSNNSVFVGDTYLIKGVAGVVLWKLLTDYQTSGRTAFSNRELRLDPSLGLPGGADNLESRLVLLQRRLAEHSPHLQLQRVGRGRMQLVVHRPLQLQVLD